MRWLFLVLWVLAGPVLADPAAVRCVQNQLAVLGHDPGPVDGAVGPKTRKALEALNETLGAEGFDLRLSRQTALVLCRELGVRDPELSRLWPEHPRRFRVTASAEVSDQARDMVATLSSRYLTELNLKLKIRLAKPVEIFVSSDSEAILAEMGRTVSGGGGRSRMRSYLKTVCGPDIPIGGFANRDRVFICLAEAAPELGKGLRSDSKNGRSNRLRLRHVLQHEMVHAVQFQLAGNATLRRGAKMPRLGPDWLTEGVAELLSVLSVRNYDLPQSVAAVVVAAGVPEKFKLSDLERESKEPAKRNALYLQGFLASNLLVRDENYVALLDYYRRIGLGRSWDEAFEASFGRSLAAFYEAFPEG